MVAILTPAEHFPVTIPLGDGHVSFDAMLESVDFDGGFDRLPSAKLTLRSVGNITHSSEPPIVTTVPHVPDVAEPIVAQPPAVEQSHTRPDWIFVSGCAAIIVTAIWSDWPSLTADGVAISGAVYHWCSGWSSQQAALACVVATYAIMSAAVVWCLAQHHRGKSVDAPIFEMFVAAPIAVPIMAVFLLLMGINELIRIAVTSGRSSSPSSTDPSAASHTPPA